ncbi:MAG: PDZ domain-containing protein [Acidobacteriota bacterium]|nr:PDZ domain-containing protein [Acidobacteriota bacterium]
MKQMRQTYFSILFIFVIFGFQNVAAQKSNLQIDYTVRLAKPESKQFHVTTDIKNINQARLDLSLPVWTPGWYVVENYGKNLLRFRITDGDGKVLPHTMSRKQTWNVDTKGIKEIKVEYDYYADTLALNQAKIANDFAFFTGIELFLQAEGHRSEPSRVHFDIPKDWKLISALRATADPLTFAADNYDVLVDAPVEMGNFDVTKFDVDGKPHYFVASPAGTFNADKTKSFTQMLAKVAHTEGQIFGELPYEKYVHFYFFAPPESNASGALEHLNSFVAFAPSGEAAKPEQLIGTAAHEFFHLWNVKRIRPLEMFPYDYARENETPLLWVSEGFTNYYGNMTTYRAGLISKEDFLKRKGDTISSIENDEARNYISPAEASVSTWLGYDSPVSFGISYYTQGENLAALLDLSIRHDTDGAKSLDDVFRALYNDFYKKGKGFSTDDMIKIVNDLTKKDYHDFYRRYAFGTEVPNYAEIYGYAGYKIEKQTRQTPIFGFGFRFRNGGLYVNSIESSSNAASSGLKEDDVILKINGDDPRSAPFGTLAGKTIKLTIKRGAEELEIPLAVGSRDVLAYDLSEMPNINAQQAKVREGWLKR